MKKLFFYLSLLFFITQFYSCSWIVGFYVINSTNETITIELKLQDSIKGSFPIFEYRDASAYSIDNRNKIDYQKSFQITYDTLQKFSHLRFKLPPKSAAQIGALHNDKYKKHDQYFINGRVFNLEKLIIAKGSSVTTITYDSFDRFFEDKNNGVEFVVK